MLKICPLFFTKTLYGRSLCQKWVLCGFYQTYVVFYYTYLFENSKNEATSLPLTKWFSFVFFGLKNFRDSLNWNFQLGNFPMRKNTLSWDTRFAHLTPLLLLNLSDHSSISSAKNLAKLVDFEVPYNIMRYYKLIYRIRSI